MSIRDKISEFGQNPNSEFAQALRLADSGAEESMVELVKMIGATQPYYCKQAMW